MRMFVARRIGGKGRRAVLGWSPRHLSWKCGEGRKNLSNLNGKQERGVVLGANGVE